MSRKMVDRGEKLWSLEMLSRVSMVGRSASQLRRWVTDGLPNRSGGRVYLEHIRIGRSFASSIESVKRFLNALQE